MIIAVTYIGLVMLLFVLALPCLSEHAFSSYCYDTVDLVVFPGDVVVANLLVRPLHDLLSVGASNFLYVLLGGLLNAVLIYWVARLFGRPKESIGKPPL